PPLSSPPRPAALPIYLAANPASATLHLADGDSVDAALLAAVRAHPDVRDAQARRTVVASALVAGNWRTALLFTAPALDAQRIGADRKSTRLNSSHVKI